MQLERKLSNSKLGDVDVSTSSLMLPGEKTMVWSDLFSYLSRPEMLQGVSPRQFKESDNQVNRRIRFLFVAPCAIAGSGWSLLTLAF